MYVQNKLQTQFAKKPHADWIRKILAATFGIFLLSSNMSLTSLWHYRQNKNGNFACNL